LPSPQSLITKQGCSVIIGGGIFKTNKMKTKQVWCKSIKDEPIIHEYNVVESKDKYFFKVNTIYNSNNSQFGANKKLASITEHGEGYTINLDNNEINIDYSDAEYLLALLSVVYDTKMEIRESVIKTKIN
jgi:hypothetical protein